jgi:hypothetical protein
MPEQIVETLQARRKYPDLSSRERELQIKNERLEGYVSRLLAERVRIVICPECQAEREGVSQ